MPVRTKLVGIRLLSCGESSATCARILASLYDRRKIMSLSLEGLKDLMQRGDGLVDNMSRTEITHYATEVLKRWKRGENIETLALYLQRLKTSSARQFQVSAATHELAERAFVLFNKSH